MPKVIKDTEELLATVSSLPVNSKLYLFGAGMVGHLLGAYLTERKIVWEGFIDNYAEQEVDVKKIIRLSELDLSENNFIIIAQSRAVRSDPIYRQLLGADVPPDKIFKIDGDKLLSKVQHSEEIVHLYQEYSRKIKIFHNIHKGKRVFIVGNGPSLTLHDLNTLHKNNEFTFGCNRICHVYDKTPWRPTYYMVENLAELFFDNKIELVHVQNQCRAFFTDCSSKLFVYRDDVDLKNLYFFYLVMTAYNYPEYFQLDSNHNIADMYRDLKDKCALFSSDCSKFVREIGTTLYSMLQMAVYMGFSELYLLGVDNTYATIGDKTNTRDHSELINKSGIEENGKMVYAHKKDTNLNFFNFAYYCAKQYCDAHGIKIYNATRGGKLEIFPRVNFDDHF